MKTFFRLTTRLVDVPAVEGLERVASFRRGRAEVGFRGQLGGQLAGRPPGNERPDAEGQAEGADAAALRGLQQGVRQAVAAEETYEDAYGSVARRLALVGLFLIFV